MELTPIQNQVVNTLSRKRFYVNNVDNCGDETPTVFMSRRHPKLRFVSEYAEVDGDGLVNGQPLDQYLQTIGK